MRFLSVVVCMSSCYSDILHIFFFYFSSGVCFHTLNTHLRTLFPYIISFSSYFLMKYLSVITFISFWLQVGANQTSFQTTNDRIYTDLPCWHAVKYTGFDSKKGPWIVQYISTNWPWLVRLCFNYDFSETSLTAMTFTNITETIKTLSPIVPLINNKDT